MLAALGGYKTGPRRNRSVISLLRCKTSSITSKKPLLVAVKLLIKLEQELFHSPFCFEHSSEIEIANIFTSFVLLQVYVSTFYLLSV